MRVFINPGHDRKYDSGAVNPVTKLREADVAYNVGKALAFYLQKVGIDVAMLQSDNLYYDSNYPDRQTPVCTASDNYKADLFISLHCNAFNTTAKGTECLVYSTSSNAYKFATCAQKQLLNTLHTVDRGIKVRQDLIVLKHTEAPACLIEMGFIDNADDVKLLTNNQDDIARAIARAVTDYQLLLSQ